MRRLLDYASRARWALAGGDSTFADELLASLEADLTVSFEASLGRDPAWEWRALMLAPNLEVWQALLTGERVPLSQLSPAWVARFGLKENT
jgi:hypothetical protein